MSAPPPVVSRPVVLSRVCWGVAVLVLTVFIGVAVGLGRAEGPVQFRLPDQVAMIGLGALLAAAALGFTRSRVRADASGIRIRNVVGDKALPWQLVRAVRMEEGDTWATLELHDDDTLALLGIQRSDGERAVAAVQGLRALLAASRSGSRPPGAPQT